MEKILWFVAGFALGFRSGWKQHIKKCTEIKDKIVRRINFHRKSPLPRDQGEHLKTAEFSADFMETRITGQQQDCRWFENDELLLHHDYLHNPKDV